MTGGSRGCSHCCRVNHGHCSECSLQRQLYSALAICLISDKITRENGHWHSCLHHRRDEVQYIITTTTVWLLCCNLFGIHVESWLTRTDHFTILSPVRSRQLLCIGVPGVGGRPAVLTPPWLWTQWVTVTSPGPGRARPPHRVVRLSRAPGAGHNFHSCWSQLHLVD